MKHLHSRADYIFDTLHAFWRRHPALLYGVCFACGVGFQWMLLLPLAIIFFPLINFRKNPKALTHRLVMGVLLCITAFLYMKIHVSFPDTDTPLVGRGVFSVSSLSKKKKFSKEIWKYRGILREFTVANTGEVVAKNIPCMVSLSLIKGANRPEANKDYYIEGELLPAIGYYSHIKTNVHSWKPIQNSFSLAEYRFHAKETVGQAIKSNVQDKRAYEFLRGIATGDFDSEELQFEFSRFGLQHIMAISGFHFAIVAGFFSVFIRLFCPRKIAAAALIFFMCSYFVFLGSTASIMRAWLMIMIVIGGCFVERCSNGLNSLGIALIAILTLDPTMVYHIGFQFSALITAGILLCYPSVDYLIQQVFSKRPLFEVIDMPLLDQHAYCVLTVFRKVLALSVTVNIISLPIAVFYFQKFPLMGFVYNWFFPFMVSVAIFLLILAFLTALVSPLSEAIHVLNTKYTSCMLDFVYNMPTNYDFYIRYQELTASTVVIFLTLVFTAGIMGREIVENHLSERKDFAFI